MGAGGARASAERKAAIIAPDHPASPGSSGGSAPRAHPAACLLYTSSSYENNLKIPPVDILVDFAVLYHVSLDYLVGLERRDSISIDGLTERQVDLISTILLEFRNPENAGNRGLTPRQVNILSNLLIEFARPDV